MEIEPISNLIHLYPSRFYGAEFVDLITSIDKLETEIHSDLINRFAAYILASGGDFYGRSLRLDGINYKFAFGFDIDTQTISIVISATRSESQKRTRHHEIKVAEFGPVRTLATHAPDSIDYIIVPWLDDAYELIRSAYQSLEDAFVNNYLRWRFSLLDQLYSITNTHLRLTSADGLIGRYWFSVTTIQKGRFRYHLDRVAMNSAISWFKEHETQICGLHAIISLLVEEPEDGVFQADQLHTEPHKIDNKTIILEFSKLPHIRSRADFAVAEHELYATDSMACLELITTADLSLQLNCPSRDYETYKTALEAAAKDIRSIFLNHRQKHDEDMRKMEGALDKVKAKYGNSLRNLFVDVTAKAIAESSKP